jgi:hypothetical protein
MDEFLVCPSSTHHVQTRTCSRPGHAIYLGGSELSAHGSSRGRRFQRSVTLGRKQVLSDRQEPGRSTNRSAKATSPEPKTDEDHNEGRAYNPPSGTWTGAGER